MTATITTTTHCDGLVLPTGKLSEDRNNHLFLLLKKLTGRHTCATTFGTR